MGGTAQRHDSRTRGRMSGSRVPPSRGLAFVDRHAAVLSRGERTRPTLGRPHYDSNPDDALERGHGSGRQVDRHPMDRRLPGLPANPGPRRRQRIIRADQRDRLEPRICGLPDRGLPGTSRERSPPKAGSWSPPPRPTDCTGPRAKPSTGGRELLGLHQRGRRGSGRAAGRGPQSGGDVRRASHREDYVDLTRRADLDSRLATSRLRFGSRLHGRRRLGPLHRHGNPRGPSSRPQCGSRRMAGPGAGPHYPSRPPA